MHQNLTTIYLIGFSVMGGLLLTARLLLWASGGRLRLQRLRGLHPNETGSVQSLSFVLALPFFIMIMMGIVQASQIMIAQIVVEYAAISAARCASVWLPSHVAENSTDGRNRISELSAVGGSDGGTVYRVNIGGPSDGEAYASPKVFRISMAAVQACLSICPSRATGGTLEQPGGGAHETMVRAYGSLVPSSEGDPAIARRLKNKLAYSLTHTKVRMQIYHPPSEPALQQEFEDIDQIERIYLTGMLPGVNGEPPTPIYHPDFEEDSREFQDNEAGWQDEITVKVEHDLALLPGPGRLLSKWVYSQDGSSDKISETIEQEESGYTWPLSATATSSNEGQKSVIRYEHQMSGIPY